MRKDVIVALVALPCLVAACSASNDGEAPSEATAEALAGYNLAAPPETTARDAFVGDFDGDGKADAARWLSTSLWDVTLSCGADFRPRIWNGDWGSDGPIHVGDLNGDHKSDVFMWRDADKVWTVNLSNGSTFVPAIWRGAWGSDGPIYVGDVNGDGKSDVFMSRDADHTWSMNVSTGSGFRAATWTGAWGSDGPTHLGDLNGDGKTDVFMWRDADKVWTVNLSTGSGWNAQIWRGAWGSDGEIHVGDLNGDGKTDVFMFRASDHTWSVNLSTGSGFVGRTWQGDWGTDGPINVGDLNGDGKSDVFMWRDADKVWTVNLSTGTGFAPAMWYGDWGSDGPIHVADLNGDRKADVFMHRADDVWTVNLSTGSGFRAAMWWSAPLDKPVIHHLDTNPYYAKSGDPLAITYDVAYPARCSRTAWYVAIDNHTGDPVRSPVTFTPDPSGKGSVAVDTHGLPDPPSFEVGFVCAPNACGDDASFATGYAVALPPIAPPTPKIDAFTVSPNDHDPHLGYTCYGLTETLSWSVSFPGSSCAKHTLSIAGTDDDANGRPIFFAEGLPASGELVRSADTDAHYTLTATCVDDGQQAKATLRTAIAPASQCSTSKPPSGDTYCFKAIGKQGGTCAVDEIYAASEDDAQTQFDREYPSAQWETETIDCSEATSACPSL